MNSTPKETINSSSNDFQKEKQNLNGEQESSSLFKTSSQSDNFKVVIRVRPALPREMEVDLPFRSIVNIYRF